MFARSTGWREKERGKKGSRQSPPISTLTLSLSVQQLLNQKLSVDPKAGRGLTLTDTHRHTGTQTHTVHSLFLSLSLSSSVSRQVDCDVLAQLQGSSLTPFEPMSQDNSQRFQSYCQHFPPPPLAPQLLLFFSSFISHKKNAAHYRRCGKTNYLFVCLLIFFL